MIFILIVLLVITGAVYAGSKLIMQEMRTSDSDAKLAAQKKTDEIMSVWQEQVAEVEKANEQLGSVDKPQPAASGWDVVDLSSFPLENTVSQTVTRQALLLGGGILVNYWHSVPGDLPEDQLVSVQTHLQKRWQVSATNVKMFTVAVEALDKMLTAAKAEGLENYIIETGYRTMETQQAAWDKEAALSKYKNYSGEGLNTRVNKVVSYPGTSEYQSGFACCIQRYKAGDAEFNKAFAGTEHSDWLQKNAWKYGFVFRYPIAGYPSADTVDKSWITGRSNKLSVYRYVGMANAAVMQKMDWCMEEYYEYLLTHPHIAVYEDGVLKYEIVRVRYDGNGDTSVNVCRNCKAYEVSMDNLGGIILSMTY